MIETYQSAGYECFPISALDKNSLDDTLENIDPLGEVKFASDFSFLVQRRYDTDENNVPFLGTKSWSK